MATEAQIRANRQNCLKSTGPRTEAGKAASSVNSVKHGLTARVDRLLEEEEARVADLVASYSATLRPADAIEETLVQHMAVDEVRRQRGREMIAASVRTFALHAAAC